LCTKGQHATPRPLKLIKSHYIKQNNYSPQSFKFTNSLQHLPVKMKTTTSFTKQNYLHL